MTAPLDTHPASSPPATTTTSRPTGTRPSIVVHAVTRRIGTTTTLHPTSFSVDVGEVVGIAGGSGAGKTTLLEIVAGVTSPTTGRARRAAAAAFVPQDDIIHRDLPLRRTLLHAASLRIADAASEQRAAAVDDVLRRLDLAERADVVVGELSGGQRKRASLAAEMLNDPEILFLDEPTSGLDPANAAMLMRSFRGLAAGGATVVLSTHSPDDLSRCDRVVFLARGGHVVFVGTPDDALDFFDVASLVDVYERLDDWPVDSSDRPDTDIGGADSADAEIDEVEAPCAPESTDAPSAARQWVGLVRRNVDLIRSNRLTLAILAGSPAFIIATMTYLFPAGVFDTGVESAGLAIQSLFWMAFNSFFFGITYGLLQVVGEFEIVRRERRVGLSVGAYVAAKLAVLLPMLAVVNAAQLVVMEAAGRLPDMTAGERIGLFVSLQLLSTAAVVIGLHASSAVHNAAQATLALPMLCFPQVLFAGAVVPVSEMGWFGEMMSMPLAVRWGFEPLGRILDLAPAASAEAGTVGFVDAFTGTPLVGWSVLVLLAGLGTVATVRTLRTRTAPGIA